MANSKKNVDPERSARARHAHDERRKRQEEQAEKARLYDEMTAGVSTQVARADNVHEHVPTEQVLGGEVAEAVAEAQEELPIVEVPLGTPLVRTPSTKPDDVKDSEHQAALAQAHAATQAAHEQFPKVPQDDPAIADVVVHFIEDGFTALGKVFYMGETLSLKRGSEAFQQTVGRDGRSWLDDDDARQFARRGRVYYKPGPFPKGINGEVTDEEEQAAMLSSDPDDLLRIKKRKAREATARSPMLARN